LDGTRRGPRASRRWLPEVGLGLSGSPHDLGGAVAIGVQQDDLGTPDMLLRTVPIGDNRLQLGSVGGAQFDLASFGFPRLA